MTGSVAKLWRIFDAALKRRFLLLMAMTVAASIAEALGLGLLLPLLNMIMDPAAIERLPVAGGFLRTAAGWLGSSQALVTVLASLIFVVFLAKNVFLTLLTNRQAGFVWDNYAHFASRLLRFYLGRDYEFHLATNSAVLANNIYSVMRQVFMSFIMPLVMIGAELMVVVSITALMVAVEPKATLIAVGCLVLVAALYDRMLKRRMSRWGSLYIEHFQQAQLWLNQGLGSVKELSVLGRQGYFVDRFDTHVTAVARYSRLNSVAGQLPRLILETVVVGGIVVIVLTSSDGEAFRQAIPTLGLFAMAALRIMPSISRIVMYAGNLRYGIAAIDKMEADLSAAVAAATKPAPVDLRPIGFTQAIAIEGVSFTYAGAQQRVLDDLWLTVQKGEAIALVGGSGAGKTTLADILLGLLAPQQGRVRVDGADIACNLRRWQNQIGYIPQDVFLIDDTLRRNIALGLPDGEIDEARIVLAVDKAQLGPTIAAMPDGLATVVGERGVRLSGGQRQRIGIARALYSDAQVLVMDEATSALDAETEHAITRSIERLRGERTLILIAHRLSTVKNCDRLYLMREGRIAAAGSFAQLLKDSEEFRSMVRKLELSAEA